MMGNTTFDTGRRHSAKKFPMARLSSAIALGLLCCGPLALHAQPTTSAVQGQTQDQDASQAAATSAKPSKKKPTKAESKQIKDLAAVEVTGVRGSLMSSQQIKENASQIVDSITSVDIGALPDRSVTETLQRVPGVTVDHFLSPGDPDHPSAEGSGVLIRGLTQVRGELNGRDVFSANSGRGLSFEDVPAELMAGVDVYKNPSADIIEGGIGGTVNLRTRLPFDSPGQVIGFTGGVNSGDLSHKGKPEVSFLYSNRWKTDNYGEFGALFDVAYSGLATRSDGIQVEPYVRRTDAAALAGTNFSQVYVPGGADWRTLDFERRRIGLAGALQWRPDRDTEITTQVLRSGYNMNWNEHAAFFNDSNNAISPAPGTTFNYNNQGVFQSGWLSSNSWRGSLAGDGVRFNTDNRYASQFTITTDWSTHFKRNLNDHMVLSGDVQFVKSTSRNTDFTVFDATYLPGMYLNVTRPAEPVVTINPASYVNNPANYFWAAAMDHHEQQKGMERAYRLDLEYDFEDSNWLQYWKVGVRATNRNETNKTTGWNWGVITDNWATIDSPNGLANMQDYLPSMSSMYSFSNFFRGNVNVPAMYAPIDALSRNYRNAYTVLHSIGVPWGWSPNDTYGLSNVNNQAEKTQAAYGILFFGNDSAVFGHALDGNIGVRVVRTSEDATGWGQYPNLSATGVPDALKQQYAGQFFPNNGHSDYKNVLPSLNLRLKLTDDLQWRFAASKALARPDFNQLNPYIQLSATLNSDNTAVTRFNGVAGNPNLKPMVANQYDTALEWYFSPTGHLFSTLFYKDISNWISTQTVSETYNNQQWLVTRPYNTDHGRISGAEAGYSQFFDFLPGWLKGFGVQANYTYVHSQGGVNTATDPYSNTVVTGVVLPLAGLSKNTYNVIGMYDYGPWSIRLAWNWRSRYLLATSDAATHLPVWGEHFGQLDGSIFYRINKAMQIGLTLNDLNNARTRVLMGPTSYADGFVDHTLYTRGTFVNDRRAELVFRANL